MKKKLLLITIIFFNVIFANQQYIRLKTGIHFDSSVSGGKYSLEELGQIIDQSDLDVAIITDHDNMDVTIGSGFFRKAFSFTVRRNSVSKFGTKNYINKINQINQYYPDVEIIPGIEAVPYYSWQGRALDQNLVLKNWHRHLLVFGMNNWKDYENLPSIKTGFPTITRSTDKLKFFSKHFFYYFLILLLYLILFLTFFTCIKRQRRRRRKPLTSRVLLMFLIFIFLAIEFPYLRSDVTQYDSSTGLIAFQELIDYVNDKNGLVFWAHPEAEYKDEIPLKIPYFQNSMKIETDHYSHLVYETENHSGFAGFWEGMKVLGKPGGLWDVSLLEYCSGTRNKPMYVIGELDFEETNNLKNINETNTFVFAKNRTQPEIFDAIRNGRMYATRGFLGDKIVIDEFRAYNPQNETSAFMGETLKINNMPVAIHIKIEAIKAINPQTFTLYRNDIPIKDFIVDGYYDEWYIDENIPSSGKFYYKMYVGKKWQTLVTNPIFIDNN